MSVQAPLVRHVIRRRCNARLVIIPASKESDAGFMPDTKMLTETAGSTKSW